VYVEDKNEYYLYNDHSYTFVEVETEH